MIINGKERGFFLSVGAAAELADMCPDGDINRIDEVLSGPNTGKVLRASANFLCTLNKWYEISKNPEATDWLKKNEILALPPDTFNEVMTYAMSAYRDDRQTSVDVIPKKNGEPVTADA